MDIITLCNFLETLTRYKVNPNQFSSETGKDHIKLEITTGMMELGGMYDFNFEIGVKSEHPKDAERISLEIINKLHRQTDIEVGKYQVVLVLAEKPNPFFEGILEDGTFFYTCNFRIMACIM